MFHSLLGQQSVQQNRKEKINPTSHIELCLNKDSGTQTNILFQMRVHLNKVELK